MLLQDIKRCWILVIILLNGTLSKIYICDTSGNDTDRICQHKNILVVTKGTIDSCHFSSDVLNDESTGIKLCVISEQTKAEADCCQTFDCGFEMPTKLGEDKYKLTLSTNTLSKQDIVIMNSPKQKFNCSPSTVYNQPGFILNPHSCLDKGVKNNRLTKDNIFGYPMTNDEKDCEGGDATNNIMILGKSGIFRCSNFGKPDVSIKLPSPCNNNITTIETAVNIFKNLSYLVEKMGTANTAAITIGNIQGMTSKLDPKNQSQINIGITTSGHINLSETWTTLVNDFLLSVYFPKEASIMAVRKNGSFLAVFPFKDIQQEEDINLLNNMMVGIDMGVKIYNLTDPINITYGKMDKENIASCRSWDGEGQNPIWITDGCKTLQSNGRITCLCSHLTFFAVLMSPPSGISLSDFTTLSYITSIGCGVSMLFLAVALFMHFAVRKNNVSHGIKILMNLFVAIFILNLTFLTNEFIANLGIFGACVTIGALTHYFLLATFTWFFMVALHLYINQWKSPTDIKYYMVKICVAGWVTPAAVVIVLLSLGMYDSILIYSDDEKSTEMCWISNPILHQAVNVGYYGVVFIFTIFIFITTVQMSLRIKSATRKTQDNSSVKSKSGSILGLFFMLGITWAFAFFSHGPLLIASYYIFSILNSFQGLFLFIYYVKSSKTVAEKKDIDDKDTNSTVASNITLSSARSLQNASYSTQEGSILFSK